MKALFTIVLVFFVMNTKAQSLYFPPVSGTSWDTISPASLGWCQDKIDTLISYLNLYNTKAFIVLKDGKIVIEHYFGTFTADSVWYWASAGKSLTSFLTGLAQEQGYLNIHDSLPKYLGHGFSTCDTAAEDSIRIINQLTMTTGFNDLYGGGTMENHCTDDSCLVCIAAPGTRWAYHNAPYTMIHWVLDSATGIPVNTFKNNNLLASCGITGTFITSGYDETYYSKPRSFARFGLLMLGKGIWNGDTIMHDTAYFNQMINTSQNINLAYGYLWWLNGKTSYHLPDTQAQIPGELEPDAPADMYSGLGKNNQLLDVVPSMNLVMIRMGDPFGLSVEVSNVVNDSIWIRLNDVFCSSTSVQGISAADKQLEVYPNPATQTFTVRLPYSNFNVIISDAMGRKVYQQKNVNSRAEINCDNFSAGLYFLQAVTGSNIYNKKIIISK